MSLARPRAFHSALALKSCMPFKGMKWPEGCSNITHRRRVDNRIVRALRSLDVPIRRREVQIKLAGSVACFTKPASLVSILPEDVVRPEFMHGLCEETRLGLALSLADFEQSFSAVVLARYRYKRDRMLAGLVKACLEDDVARTELAASGNDEGASEGPLGQTTTAAARVAQNFAAAAAAAGPNNPAFLSLAAAVDAMELASNYVMASPRQSWSLTEHLLATQRDLYKDATQHPFLLAGAEGRLSKDLLSRWLANDRLYIHSYIRAAGKLLASLDLPRELPKSDEAVETQLVDWLIESLVGIRKEERFFIDVAERYGLGIEMPVTFPPAQAAASSESEGGIKDGKLPGLTMMESIFALVGTPTSSTQGSNVPGLRLVQTLFSSATTPPLLLPWIEGALTFWGTERCYLDAWSWARAQADNPDRTTKEDADGGALRREFIPNWSSPEFAGFVDRLGKLIDTAVAEALEGKPEGEERERAKAEILGRVEAKWKTLLVAERAFWPDV
ncbi:hypothetical protein N0V88_006851 [Collariella sp. IMI 366227]|nr:hypothetical protein N0V88_006851 [Collariella sp. IMI 366227]